MSLPKKLEEKCVNNSARYVDFDVLYHEKHNKEKSGAKEASIYREGFKNACELLLKRAMSCLITKDVTNE